MPAFTPVMPIEKIDDRCAKAVEVNGYKLAISRVGDEVFAVENRCSHMGYSLQEGPLDEDHIVCPLHAARFCARTGALRSGPGQCNLVTFPVRVKEGVVEVSLEPRRAFHPLMGKRALAALLPREPQPQSA